MSRTLRSCVIAPEGYTLISIDANQLELRVIAILSQDPNMLEDLKSTDLHLATAIRMFGLKDDPKLMKELRYKAKQANFADIYGADEYKLAEMLECSLEEAKELKEERKRTYPVLFKWVEDRIREAKALGYVTNIFGRKRPIPELSAGSWSLREKGKREVVNTLVQGTAADIIKLMMLFLKGILAPSVRMVLQVHDEILLEVPDVWVSQTLESIEELKMAFPYYPCSVAIGKNYGELEEK
jgi:DNA polymerase-1